MPNERAASAPCSTRPNQRQTAHEIAGADARGAARSWRAIRDHGVSPVDQKDAGGDRRPARCSRRAVTGSASSTAPSKQAEHRRQHRERGEPRRRVVADQPEPDQVAGEADDDDLEQRASPRPAATASGGSGAPPTAPRRSEQHARHARAGRAASSRPMRWLSAVARIASVVAPQSTPASDAEARRRAIAIGPAAGREKPSANAQATPAKASTRPGASAAARAAPTRAISGMPSATTNGEM